MRHVQQLIQEDNVNEMTKEKDPGESDGAVEQVVHHTKDEEKKKYYTYAIDNMMRASDELYHICASYHDMTLCQEVKTLLRKIIYEFDHLEKVLELKHFLPPSSHKDSSCSVLPESSKNKSILAEVTDCSEICVPSSSPGINVSAPDFVPSSQIQQSKSSYTDQSVQTSSKVKNEKRKDKKVPREESTDDEKGTFFYLESPVHFDQNNHNVPAYIDSSREYDSNFYNNHNFPHNLVSPNIYSFHPYQPYSAHYVSQMSHYHLPYSMYSHDVRNPNMMHIPQVGAYPGLLHPHFRNSGKHMKSRLTLHSDKQHKSGKIRKHSNSNCNVEKSVESEKQTAEENSNKAFYYSSVEEDNTANDTTAISSQTFDTDIFSNEAVGSGTKRDVELTLLPFENEHGNTNSNSDDNLPEDIGEIENTVITQNPAKESSLKADPDEITSDNMQLVEQNATINTQSFNSNISEPSQKLCKESTQEKQFIFGLAEDECLIHFPELSSGSQRKSGRCKVNSLNVTKKNSANGLALVNGSSHSSGKLSEKELVTNTHNAESIEDKGITFSQITKTTGHVVEKQSVPSVTPLTSSFKRKNKNNNWNGYYAPTKQTNNKKSVIEEWLDDSYVVPSTENDSEDSGGWEIVRTRSKWRDSLEFKSRQQANNSRNQKSFGVKENNSTSWNGNGESHVKSNFGKPLLAKFNNKQVSTNGSPAQKYFENPSPGNSNKTESSLEAKCAKTDGYDTFSNGSKSSNGTSDENTLQSEVASPDLGQEDGNVSIDPNEMYSTYMQYLKNVEEEENVSGTSFSEFVLHPEIQNDSAKETEKGQNPASLEQMTYFVNNDPIRALDFKKKLDSQIRHQEDVKKKNDAKQQMAHEKRLQFLHDKTAKFRGFVQKVEEVKAAQHQLALLRKSKLDLKLKKAEEKRKMHLNIIKRKAHDEEEKLKEIAFINELEAQNRRHDSLALRQEHEERLQCIVEERQRRSEEKAAKEAAVEERRKALEAERQEKLELMKEKRRRKEEFIDRKQQEKEQERLVIARERAREREERLLARHTAQQATLEELQKKIQQKQEESAKRHIESIELIRQKAIEIGIHRNTTDSVVPKYLNLYKPDLKGNTDHDKYKLYLKKRLKKIKTRMVLRGSNYIKVTHSCQKELTIKESSLEKVLKKLQKYEPHKIYMWEPEECDIVDHLLDEILLFLQEEPSLKTALKDMKAFLFFDSVINTFNYANHEKMSLPSLRCILKIIAICDLSCIESVEVCLYFLLSNVLATLLDSLRFSLQALERPCKSWDLVVEILLRFHALIFDGLNELPEAMLLTIPDFATRMKDLVSYVLCSGLVNRLIDLFRPSIIDEKFLYKSLVVPSILFFKRLLSTWFISDDLVVILKSTDLLGTVPLLYEGLMKQISNGGPLPEYCLPTISLFLRLADLDLKLFQDILGAENIALQWRGIASGLMTYCVSQSDGQSEDLLNNVIKLVGYFAIHNKNNQTLLQSGKQPTVLQQLVKLPFKYFCDPRYMHELFPTLVSCSYMNSTNRAIVEREIDYKRLERFMQSETGQKNKIIQLLLSSDS